MSPEAPRLDKAWACLDCNLIQAFFPNGYCACGSQSIFNLAAMLVRMEQNAPRIRAREENTCVN